LSLSIIDYDRMPPLSTNILQQLRGAGDHDMQAWQSLVAFSPGKTDDAASDVNMRNRHTALLALHQSRQKGDIQHSDVDRALTSFITEQEILFHQSYPGYMSSISLCCYLGSLYNYRDPKFVWTLWPAKFGGDYDVSVCVDSHFMLYAAGGIDALEEYVSTASVLGDVLEGALEDGGRARYWRSRVSYVNDDESQAFSELKDEVLERIKRDKENLTDEGIQKWMEKRAETAFWAEQLGFDEE
jgi:hypothetical protein